MIALRIAGSWFRYRRRLSRCGSRLGLSCPGLTRLPHGDEAQTRIAFRNGRLLLLGSQATMTLQGAQTDQTSLAGSAQEIVLPLAVLDAHLSEVAAHLGDGYGIVARLVQSLDNIDHLLGSNLRRRL